MNHLYSLKMSLRPRVGCRIFTNPPSSWLGGRGNTVLIDPALSAPNPTAKIFGISHTLRPKAFGPISSPMIPELRFVSTAETRTSLAYPWHGWRCVAWVPERPRCQVGAGGSAALLPMSWRWVGVPWVGSRGGLPSWPPAPVISPAHEGQGSVPRSRAAAPVIFQEAGFVPLPPVLTQTLLRIQNYSFAS